MFKQKYINKYMYINSENKKNKHNDSGLES